MLCPEQNPPCETHGCRHLSVPTGASHPMSIFWRAQQHPAQSSFSMGIRATPSQSLPLLCLARSSEKFSKEIIRTENWHTRIWICPERPFSARGWMGKLGPECEDRARRAYFSCYHVDTWLQSCSGNHAVGLRVSNKMADHERQHWSGFSGSQNVHTDFILTCSLLITPPTHLQHPLLSPIRAWLNPTYPEPKPYSLKFPPPIKERFTTKICELQISFIPGRQTNP